MDKPLTLATVRRRFIAQALVFTTLGLILGVAAPVVLERLAGQRVQPVAASVEFAPVGLMHSAQQAQRWVF